MNKIMFSMTEAGKALGITRQQTYNRMKKENWEVDDSSGQIMVDVNVVGRSRSLERELLTGRLRELDDAAEYQHIREEIMRLEEKASKPAAER